MTNSSIKSWIEELDENLLNYVNTLKINRFEYLPMKSGLTREGQEIRLGFSCFALKINISLMMKMLIARNILKVLQFI
jgi:hypothetical protein